MSSKIANAGLGADSARVMALYGQNATGAASIYGIGTAALLPFALVSVAVTTRYLELADFGRLAVLFAAAGLLTLAAGLGIVQGTIMLVYRGSDEGADDGAGVVDGGTDATDVLGPRDEYGIEEKRRMLGSGFLLVVVVATVIAVPVALVAPTVSSLLLGSSGYATAVRWMALSVWTGSIWRLAHQIWRLERHAWTWVGFQVLRPLLAVIGTVIALAAGMGIEGPLLATAVGTAVACAASMFGSRRCWLFRPRLRDPGEIWRRGRSFVPLQLAGVLQNYVSILLLAALATSSAVAIYTVAVRVAMIPTFFGHGFFLAWPTINTSPIGMAALARKGRAEHAASAFTLLCLISIGLLVLISLFAGAFLNVLAPGYGASADLIPLLAAAGIGAIAFRGIYRFSRFPSRRAWYISLLFAWLLPFTGLAVLLLPIGPTWALATANMVAYATVSVAMVWRDRRGPTSTPFQWGRLGLALAVATLCILAVELSPTGGWLRLVIVIIGLMIFPLALVRTGVVPREQVGIAIAIVRSLIPRRPSRQRIMQRLEKLPQNQREIVSMVLLERCSPEDAAAKLGVHPQLVFARLARGLRRVAGEADATTNDVEIGRYLMNSSITLERDAIARQLAREGVDPLELHQLQAVMAEIKRTGRRRRVGAWGIG